MNFNENPSFPDKADLWTYQAANAVMQKSEPNGDEHHSPLKLAVLLSKHPCNTNFSAVEEIRSLRKLGHDVALSALECTLKDHGDLNPEIKAETNANFYLRVGGLLGELASHGRALISPISYIRLLYLAMRLDGWTGLVKNRHVADVLKLERWMRKHDIKHLHAHFGTEAARVAVLMKQFRSVTLSLTLGNADDLHHTSNVTLHQKVEASDFIICSSTGTKTALMRLTPHVHWQKYEVCLPGVDILRFQPRPTRLKSELFTILCVGHLEPINGQRTVLETCKLLLQTGREIRLILVGGGCDKGELKKEAEAAGLLNSVMFAGVLHQERLCDWYSRADAFVSCSMSDGMSLPVMEAMASGIPCVSARTAGMLELMREGSEGLLVEPNSAHELAGALMRLMDDDELRRRLARYGRARILQKFSMSRKSERFGSLFHNRLSSKPTHRTRSSLPNLHHSKNRSDSVSAD